MRPHALVALVVVLAASCWSSAPPPATAPGERSRSTCEQWLRHTLDIEKQTAHILHADDTAQQQHAVERLESSYDEIRARPDFLAYCRRHSEEEFACTMQATNPDELHVCERQRAKR